MSLQVPTQEQPLLQPELWIREYGTSTLLILAAIWLALHPPKNPKERIWATTFCALALTIQWAALGSRDCYGPVVVLVLLGGLWRAWRPKSSQPRELTAPGLRRIFK